MSITKKLIVASLAVAMMFSLSVGAVAAQDDCDEILDIYADFEADLGEDMARMLIEVMEPGLLDTCLEEGDVEDEDEEEAETVARLPEGYTFTENMRQGAEGAAVENLQIALNELGFTVAESGAGSPGNETEYYGPATAAAVTNFQETYADDILNPLGLTSGTDNFYGSTRAKMNALIAGEASVEEPTDLQSVVEMLQALSAALEELRARIDDIEPGVDGEEGFMYDVRRLARPRLNEVYEGQKDAETMAFRMEGDQDGSDLFLRRATLRLEATASLRRVLEDVSLWVNGEEIAREAIDRDNVGTASNEELMITGLDVEVPAGDIEDVVVAVSISEDAGDYIAVNDDISVELMEIRYLDEAGLSETADFGDGTEDFDEVIATFDYSDEDAAKLSAEKTVDSPEEGDVTISEDTFEDVELYEFDLEAEDNDVLVEVIELTLNNSSLNYFDFLTIYNGSEIVGEEAVDGINSGPVTFSDLNLEVFEGEKVTLQVVGETRSIYRDEQGEKVSTYVSDVVAYDFNDDGVTLDLTGAGSSEVEELEIYVVVPQFSLVSSAMDLFGANDEYGDGEVVFDMEAMNENVFLHYIDFDNTGTGTLTDPIITFEGDEIGVALAGKEDLGELTAGAGNDAQPVSNVGSYNVGDYVMNTNAVDGDYAVYEVTAADASPGAITEVNGTDYAGFANAVAGDLVIEPQEITAVSEVSVAGIIEGDGSRERVKIDDIGWATEEDTDFGVYEGNFPAVDYDFIDVLESVREYIVAI